jgi:hypothetical protein
MLHHRQPPRLSSLSVPACHFLLLLSVTPSPLPRSCLLTCLLLQRWEAHNREQAAASRSSFRTHTSGPEEDSSAGTAGQQGASSSLQGSGVALASEALHRWASVSRKSRAALRQANVSSVLALESQVGAVLGDHWCPLLLHQTNLSLDQHPTGGKSVAAAAAAAVGDGTTMLLRNGWPHQ